MTIERLVADAEAIRSVAAATHPWLERREIVGIGWATVELQRAAVELAPLCAGWAPVPRDALLGATAWRCRAEGGIDLLLLEPDTEGRIAASLVRFGESVAAVYVQGAAEPNDESPRVSSHEPGPLGTARLALGGPPWGPHVVVLEGAAR